MQRFYVDDVVEGIRLHLSTDYDRACTISSSEALVVIRDITDQAQLNEMKSNLSTVPPAELRTRSPLPAMADLTDGGTPEEWRRLEVLQSELNVRNPDRPSVDADAGSGM